MTQKENFMYEQQKAVERMMEMNRRSKPDGSSHNMPPAPPFVKLNENTQKRPQENSDKIQEKFNDTRNKESQFQTGFNLPILDSLKIDRDTTLILGLLLILWSEKSDRYLLLALLYILL